MEKGGGQRRDMGQIQYTEKFSPPLRSTDTTPLNSALSTCACVTTSSYTRKGVEWG